MNAGVVMGSPGLEHLLPLRLGYFLLHPDAACACLPTATYEGVDRLWILPSPEELDELRADGRHRLVALWDNYWDSAYDRTLHADRALAQRLQQAFREEGVPLDLGYIEIARTPDDPEYGPGSTLWTEDFAVWRGVHDRLGGRPDGLRFLGLDLSRPVPTFHSAIFEPGPTRSDPELPRHLNRHCLFESEERAATFLIKANSTTGSTLPFFVLSVWEVK
ncbi:MAG TPA: hypothetical protein VH482_03590 [Thermomicrobiales bacterium]